MCFCLRCCQTVKDDQKIYSNLLKILSKKYADRYSQIHKTMFDLWMIWHCLCFSSLLPSSPCSLSSSNNLLTFPECPEDTSVEAESEDDITASHTSLERPSPHRGNTMVHVCWHRNTSVSMVDFSIAVEVPAKNLRPAPFPSCLTVSFLCVWVSAVP